MTWSIGIKLYAGCCSEQLCLFSDSKPELMGNFVTKACKTVKPKNAMWAAVSEPPGEKNKKYQNLVWDSSRSGVRTLALGHCYLSVFFSLKRDSGCLDETYFKWNAPPLFWPCSVPLACNSFGCLPATWNCHKVTISQCVPSAKGSLVILIPVSSKFPFVPASPDLVSQSFCYFTTICKLEPLAFTWNVRLVPIWKCQPLPSVRH